MTDDYKDALLKYLTGNIKDYPLPNGITGYYDESTNTTNDLQDYLENELGSTFTVHGMLQSENYDNYILYGDRRANAAYYGFLLIVDSNFNPIELIKTYDSGTLLGRFLKLAIDEKNQIYGVDYNSDTTTYRFIMLNNVFATGIAKLRQSYSLPSKVSSMHGFQITKDPNSANYLIAGMVFSGNVNQPRVAQLKINVGSENEWTYYTYSDTLLATESELSNIYSTWDEEVPDFQMSAFTDYQFIIYSKYQENLIQATLYDVDASWQLTTIYNTNSIIADENTCYYAVHATADGQELISIYQIKNGVQTFITGYPLDGTTTSNNYIEAKLRVLNGTLFFIEVVPNGSNYNILAGSYKDGVIDETTFMAEDITIPLATFFTLFDTINNFNLYKYNYQIGNTLYSIKLLYNQYINFEENLTGYNNYHDLKPLTMSIYSNNSLLFNRNLYNLVVNASTTTSTVEVPNTMLNGITLDGENLIGNHYLQISQNEEDILTNIYETLHINTINTLSMINLDTNILYPNGSARLNNSVNMTQDYNNAKCSKARINYADETTKIIDIKFYPKRNYFYTLFALYVDKEISSIDFLSNDEATIYNKITPTFTVGNIYTIRQDVYINEKIITEPVLYDNVQVQYNGEDVYY